MNIHEARKRFKKIKLKEWPDTLYLDIKSHTILDSFYDHGELLKSIPKWEINKQVFDDWEEWIEPIIKLVKGPVL